MLDGGHTVNIHGDHGHVHVRVHVGGDAWWLQSSTCTKPRVFDTSMLMSASPRPSEKGARPVQTMHASTSSVSTSAFVLASIISIVTGLTPGIPGVTCKNKRNWLVARG